MNVLWLYAHPEARSLNGALRRTGIETLAELGHDVRESDLYAMRWNPVVDSADFTDHAPGERLVVGAAAKHAYETDTLSTDVRGELDKLAWADAIVIQFPLWWYGMPAILKGWFDRVFVKGLAYGIRHPELPGRTLRYGEGMLAGKRAMVVLSAGSGGSAFGPRGINGQLDQALFPLLHGTLWYTGMDVLPPLATYGADRVSDEQYEDASAMLRKRLAGLGTDAPLAYRSQNGGDYDDDLVLRPDHAPSESGLGVHLLR